MSQTECHYQLDSWRFKVGEKNLELRNASDAEAKPLELPKEGLKVKYFQNRKLEGNGVAKIFFLIVMCALLMVGTALYGYTSVVGLVPEVAWLPVVPVMLAGLAVMGAVIVYLILAIKEETHQLLVESDSLHGKVVWSYTTTLSDKRLLRLFEVLSR